MDPMLLRAVVVVGLVAAIGLVAAWWRRRDGALRTGDGSRLHPEHLHEVGLDLSRASAGAVLLGSPSCAPCESAKRVLDDLAGERQDFAWVYADAGDHADIATSHRVMRVPTVLVLDGDGRVVARASGVPRHEQLRDMIDTAPGHAA